MHGSCSRSLRSLPRTTCLGFQFGIGIRRGQAHLDAYSTLLLRYFGEKVVKTRVFRHFLEKNANFSAIFLNFIKIIKITSDAHRAYSPATGLRPFASLLAHVRSNAHAVQMGVAHVYTHVDRP